MNKIISIDKDAETYRQGIEKLLIEKEMELEKNTTKIMVKMQLSCGKEKLTNN